MFAFQPKNDLCLDCGKLIKPKAERNYIVWDGSALKRGGQCYRRECATCHDKRTQQPLISTKLSTMPKEAA